MLDYSNCSLDIVSVHQVGNRASGEELFLSNGPLDLSDRDLNNMLIQYFLTPFAETEFYHFTSGNDDFNLNPVFKYADHLFQNPDVFHDISKSIAKHHYDQLNLPKMKPGDLFIARFSDIKLEDKLMDVIGLFKAETVYSFLKLRDAGGDFKIDYDDGINIEKLDKGCLIFNAERSAGYRVAAVEKGIRFGDARYWKDEFLQLAPRQDNFHQTKEFLGIAKNYIANQITDEFELDRTDQIDMLNRSIHYFKNHDAFNMDEFSGDVFYDQNVVDSFKRYNDAYESEHEIQVDDRFVISPQAVKKQERIFKSVLKLDKNFHIYIHGDKSMIEKGREHDGRKFYKIYFDVEK